MVRCGFALPAFWYADVKIIPRSPPEIRHHEVGTPSYREFHAKLRLEVSGASLDVSYWYEGARFDQGLFDRTWD